MSVKSVMTHDENGPEINFKKIQDIIYWSKKWEISPHQLIDAYQALQNNNVKAIEAYLRGKGFAV
jgi:hypothetical protein